MPEEQAATQKATNPHGRTQLPYPMHSSEPDRVELPQEE